MIKSQEHERLERASRLFRSLSELQSLRLLLALTEQAELNVSELREKLGTGQSAVSHHLSVLLDRGLVERRRDSRFTYYWIRSKYVRSVLSDLKLGIIQ